MLFFGEFEHAIDAKGRLAIPSEIRGALDPEKDGQSMYLTLGANRTLRLYTEKLFEKLSDQLDQDLVTDSTTAKFDELLFPMTRKVDFDTAGRVRIPEQMRKRANLGKEVILIGVRDHLQIRDRAQWEADLEAKLQEQEEILTEYARRRRKSAASSSSSSQSNDADGEDE
ncbi:MAG: hypothetical protein D8M59_02650 [Planctomycetes bacterium]|nr:hypothetical protein [Planctomycetota bacterium]NOG52891.1 hypothetical protein [Planctomycetota bacterium]